MTYWYMERKRIAIAPALPKWSQILHPNVKTWYLTTSSWVQNLLTNTRKQSGAALAMAACNRIFYPTSHKMADSAVGECTLSFIACWSRRKIRRAVNVECFPWITSKRKTVMAYVITRAFGWDSNGVSRRTMCEANSLCTVVIIASVWIASTTQSTL